jgi:hypothetical protein
MRFDAHPRFPMVLLSWAATASERVEK